MGLSASQARFLQLTARRSNIEYEVQQISFQRLQIAEKLSDASTKYQDAVNNRKLVLNFNNGTGTNKVDLSYKNYKNYMNQQMDGVSTNLPKYYLVSSTGNKFVVASEEERDQMLQQSEFQTQIKKDKASVDAVYAKQQEGEALTDEEKELLTYRSGTYCTETDSEGNIVEYYAKRNFSADDFIIVENLDDIEAFQSAITEGYYYFATLNNNDDGSKSIKTEGWDSIGSGGAISEEYDKEDDAAAEAEYNSIQQKLQKVDKKLELRIDQLETARKAIQTEIESVEKVIDDNIDKSFKTLG